jgi:deazaflavin-dependent oxidoreductase (nitroreductase family)
MGLLTPLAVRIGAQEWMPRLLPQITAIDNIAGLPNLLLTVPGRKTGTPRTTPLLCVPRGDTFLIAGSYFGGAKEPIWVANLEAAGAGELRFRGSDRLFTARRLTGEERVTAWIYMMQTWPNFKVYEERTEREIKVFELTPTDLDASAAEGFAS